MLRAFEKGCEPGTQPEAEGFFAKVKDFLKGDAAD